jgi:hypothetical protein
MKKGQNTRGYQRYMALDIHREYILVGAQDEEKDWVLTPRRVSTEKFAEWAKKNIRTGDIVVLETATNVWATYAYTSCFARQTLIHARAQTAVSQTSVHVDSNWEHNHTTINSKSMM